MTAINGVNLGWAVFATVLHTLALFSTVFRLVHRLRTSRMWWDDYMVALPLGLNAVYFASLWMLYNFRFNKSDQESPPPRGINSFWVSQFIFFSVIWSCRISIALTLARIFPAFHKARRSALFLAAMCFLGYLCCIFVLTFECPSNAPWYMNVVSNCHKTGSIFVGGLVAAVLVFFVDSVLILFPIITLWKVKLPRNLRRIIISAFSGSTLTLTAAIIFCIVRYGDDLVEDRPNIVTVAKLSSHLEAAISLAVSNLLVIVSYLYRIFRRGHDLESADLPIDRKSSSEVMEGQGAIGFVRETSIGRVSVLDTEDRPLSFTLTRFSQLVWSSMRVSEPPCLLSQSLPLDI